LKKPCHLEATQKHAAAALKSAGRPKSSPPRASVQQISEAVAARRSAKSTHTRKSETSMRNYVAEQPSALPRISVAR